MKIIVHAPAHAAGMAAELAASSYQSGDLQKWGLIGILRFPDKFSIRLNKCSISVWHHFADTPA